ncbi:BspA family leucine-rich repeat surface protein [Marivirga salinae]|uniref:BspA family leucine-rich repeat surface protein n=1 Tax=Marivirga salinarum TaxID=3059078 RepID=A0AA51NAP0_9BACT|nr:BspA family leucine-rich repeat surface protein [Marivirga sp. BDSF4-3]WMN11887.1 BspA family leucine-rich repeat surface protein [Marivirga sp. BDSF4-3]
MKRLLPFFSLLLFCAFLSSNLFAQNPFTTTWKTTDGTITIPVNPADTLVYNYDISWTNLTNNGVGDGSDTGITGNYPISGLNNNDTYEIKISGNFPAIYFNNGPERNKIQTIEQWGDIEWETMRVAFLGCSNLTSNATDAPNLQTTKSLLGMFAFATSFNSDLNNWDVSNITNMYGAFINATSFNSDISNWNMENVDTTSYMFYGATSFNSDISNWDVGNVINMEYMFYNAISFNGDLNDWDVLSVINMRSMFQNASSFNRDLSGWYTWNVENMANMFSGASSFNHSLGTWTVSDVTNMSGMLDNSGLSKRNYDATIIGWESDFGTPSNITLGAAGLTYCNSSDSRQTLTGTFYNWVINGDALDCQPFVTTWQTADNSITISTDTSIGTYFYNITWENLTTGAINSATQQTGDYTISDLTNGVNYEISITGDFPKIDFGNAFNERSKIQSIDQWGDIEWADFSQSFYNCVNLTSNAPDSPLLTNVTDMSSMFSGATSFNSFNDDLNNWDVSNIENMNSMFRNAEAFNSNLSGWDLRNVSDMGSMFSGATSLDNSAGLSSWNVSNVNLLDGLFSEATSFNADLSSWDVSNVTDMGSMFSNASSFESDLSSWDVRNVTDMRSMFRGATLFESDLSDWSVSNVSDMSWMFNNATNFDSDLSNWNVGSVTRMNAMFAGASSFNSDLSNWDVRNVVEMSAMFKDATLFNNDLSNWDVSKVRNMAEMFRNANSFNQSLANWDISSVNNQSEGLSDLSFMLTNSGLSTFNYDAIIKGWATLSAGETQIPTNITLGADNLNFCFSIDERLQLINNYSWNIIDSGPDCPTPETQASNIIFPDIAHSQMNISWENGDGANRLVLAKQNNAVDANPADLSTYVGDAIFGEGDEIGNGNFVIYNGAGNGLTITGLDEGTFYHFQVFEYNGENGLEAYNTSTANDNPAFEKTLATPVITSFTPTTAIKDDSVRIKGENFTDASTVSFGGTEATFFKVVSDSAITAVVGDGSSGDVAVTTSGGTATLDGFNFIFAPIIDAFSPTIAAEDDTVTITGSYFNDASLVSFGGTEASFFTVVSDSVITAVVGNGSSGNVAVTTPGGTATLDGFNFIPAPIIDAFSPTIAAEDDTVTIIGSYFNDASLVRFGGTEASFFTVVSDSVIIAILGPGSSGDVLVNTPGGTSTLEGFNFIPAPIIDAFSPITASKNDTVTITGLNFNDANLVSFGGTEASDYTVVSANEISAIVGAGASGNVRVRTLGGTATLDGFTFTKTEIAVFYSDSNPITNNQSESIDLGIRFPDETLERQFTIQNTGTGDLAISSITSSDAAFEVLNIPDSIDPGSSAQFTLLFNPTDFKVYESNITINNNSINNSEFNFTVSAEFSDLNIIDFETDSILISNQDVNLGTTFINQNIDKNFVIENQSSKSTIEIIRIIVDNPVFQIINAPISVAPLSSENFIVRLNATAVGDYNGTVTIMTTKNDFSFKVAGKVLPEASTEIKVFNVITPNGDGRHDFLQIENITEYPNNKVSIFNRLGNNVFEINNYDNSSRIFEGISDNGKELLTGNYYYVIDKGNGDKRISGFLVIKR